MSVAADGATGSVSETPDVYGEYPRLSPDQIDGLVADGVRRAMARGEVLYRQGDRRCDFFVILAGTVTLLDGYGTPEERVIGVHGPGRFLGELSLLTGEAVFVTAVAHEAGEVLVVPVERLRSRVAQ